MHGFIRPLEGKRSSVQILLEYDGTKRPVLTGYTSSRDIGSKSGRNVPFSLFRLFIFIVIYRCTLEGSNEHSVFWNRCKDVMFIDLLLSQTPKNKRPDGPAGAAIDSVGVDYLSGGE